MIVRHWFPVIAGGITFALILAVAAVYAHRVQQQNYLPAETVDASAPAQTEEEYQQAVRTVLAAYEADANADAAYDTLLYITRIPASMKDVHISLVGAFGKLTGKDSVDGERRLEALKAQYSWLNL